jgi:hypothetical protein
MKYTRFIVSIIALVGVISGAHAIKLCQLDWLNAWKNASGVLQNSRRSQSVSNYDDTTSIGGLGRWSVTSDQGSAGVHHTVSGESFCSDKNSGVITDGSPSISSISPNNNCWCRMSAPNLGASWVFLHAYSIAADCAYNCAGSCAGCIQYNMSSPCTRSAVLTLP